MTARPTPPPFPTLDTTLRGDFLLEEDDPTPPTMIPCEDWYDDDSEALEQVLRAIEITEADRPAHSFTPRARAALRAEPVEAPVDREWIDRLMTALFAGAVGSYFLYFSVY
jgi:hypothetical protein